MMNTLLFGGAAVIAMLLAGPFILPRIFAQAARTKSPEVFLAASLLVVIMASLATALTGLSPIVGALLAGLLIAETDYHGEVESITAPFRGLALGVFLLTVGMSLDLGFIAERWPSLLLAVGGVVVIKTLVTAFLLRLYGARRSIAAEVGILMSSPSETTLIVLLRRIGRPYHQRICRDVLADRHRHRPDAHATAGPAGPRARAPDRAAKLRLLGG
jgi:CPA2 family monovalent cation:H+ antiporter-2